MSDLRRAHPTPRKGITPLDRAALVVIDLQNDFCAADGVARSSRHVEDPAAIEAAIDRIIALIDAFRCAGAPCIFVRSFMDDKYKLPNLLRRHKNLGLTRQMCKENTWGAEFYRLKIDDSDCIVTKHTNDAFLYTYLEPLLRKFDTNTVVLTGVYTELCVEDTARSAIQRGFHVVVPEDCTAGLSELCAKASLKALEAFQIDVPRSAAILPLVA